MRATARAYTWESLRELTARRQFPRVRGRGPAAVVELIGRVGPIQAQSPRAPFLAVSSRLPGACHAAVTQAYESLHLVRATSLRGTVHTSVRHQHAWLAAVGERTQANLWRRTLGLTADGLRLALDEIARFTAGGWRTHHELNVHMARWLADQGLGDPASVYDGQVGSAVLRGYPALVRRPLTGSWDQSGTTGYRIASAVLGDPPVDADTGTRALVRTHLGAFGPATRRDIAWWSGEGLRRVDAALAGLRDELTARPGPADAVFHDLIDRPGSGSPDPGIRLLAEYDSVLLGYHPGGRERFADRGSIGRLWNPANGVFSPAVLSGGRIRAAWRPVRAKAGVSIVATMLPGESMLDASELEGQAAAVGAALDVSVTDIRVLPPTD